MYGNETEHSNNLLWVPGHSLRYYEESDLNVGNGVFIANCEAEGGIVQKFPSTSIRTFVCKADIMNIPEALSFQFCKLSRSNYKS